MYMNNAEEFWITARGVTRLDGARGKMRIFTVLKNVRVTLLGFFGVPTIIRRPRSISAPPQWFGARVIAPPCPFVTTLLIEP